MRKIIIIVIVTLITNIMSINAAIIEFTDINKHWAKANINKLINIGIINGYPNGSFKPDNHINVDSFIKLTVAALGYRSIPNSSPYWATNYIDKGLELSIIEDGQYDTYTRAITREEMASIAGKALGYIQKTKNIERSYKFILKTIKDYKDVNDRYKQEVVESYYYGLMTGKPDGFHPQGLATRAEAATLIVRLMDETSRKPIFVPWVATMESISVDDNKRMYFDFIKYKDYKNDDSKVAREKKKINRIYECPDGEVTALQLLYGLEKVYRDNEGYVRLGKIEIEDHPIGIKYECMDQMRSEVILEVRHSKHDSPSAYHIKLDKIDGLSYIERYHKYNKIFDTMIAYLYEDNFHIVKENILDLLKKAENTDISKYTYIMELNDREMYVEIEQETSIDIQFTIKGGERGIGTSTSIKEANDFQLTGLDGEVSRLSEYKDKKVYIKFWNTWCSVCTDGLVELEELSSRDNDFEVITIVSPGYNGEKTKQDFIEWYRKQGYDNITVLFDVGGKIAKKYDVKAYPTSIFINTEGMLIKRETGHMLNTRIIDDYKLIK